MGDHELHIAIDVSVADGQIRGHVGTGVGPSKAFCGWLELLGHLDGLLGAGPRLPVADDDRFLHEEAP